MAPDIVTDIGPARGDFTFRGETHTYCQDAYNNAALNERAVEVPVAADWVAGRAGRGLEVGNVLGHYGYGGHDVVDRWEQAYGVRNVDVFDLVGEWDWIVTVSTLEHVRWDEPGVPRDDGAAIQALWRLRALLAPGGAMLVSVPTGWNPGVDRWLASGSGARWETTMVRDGAGWVDTGEVTLLPYGLSTIWAESVWFGEFAPART